MRRLDHARPMKRRTSVPLRVFAHLGAVGCRLAGSACLLLAGCGLSPRDSFTARDADAANGPGLSRIRIWADAPSAKLVAFLTSPDAPLSGRCAANYLALSGGGSDGAFGAGLLKGWTSSGTRPAFDIVTGISTGALLAPLAFLGSEYDAELERLYVSEAARSMNRLPNPLVPFTTASLIDSQPLRELIARNVTDTLMGKIATEYRKGRQLLVVTTNLDAQRPVLWNMGALAATGRPDALELFREILLASSSIPGLFPPVLIKSENSGTVFGEMHVDGGASTPIQADPALVAALGPFDTPACRRRKHLWLVINNTQMPEFRVVPDNGAAILLRSYSTIIKAETRGFATAAYEASRRLGVEYSIAYIDKATGYDPIKPFRPGYTQSVFAIGEQEGASGTAWHSSLDRMQDFVAP